MLDHPKRSKKILPYRNTWNNVYPVDMNIGFKHIITISSLLPFVIAIIHVILRDGLTKVTDLLLKINYEIVGKATFLLV